MTKPQDSLTHTPSLLKRLYLRFRYSFVGRFLHCAFVRKRLFFTWTAIGFAWFAWAIWADMQLPIPPLEQLDHHTGVVMDYGKFTRYPCKGTLLIRGDDGEERWWRGCYYWDKEKFRKLIGKHVRFFTRKSIDPLPLLPVVFHYDEVFHIVTDDGKVILDYKKTRPNMLSASRSDSLIIKYCLIIAAILGTWIILWCLMDLLKEDLNKSPATPVKEENDNGEC